MRSEFDPDYAPTVDLMYAQHLHDLNRHGMHNAPRGKGTRQMLNKTLKIDPKDPVILNGYRDLNYRFMAAEAYWILTGDDTVDGIVPWNRNIEQFSDDGKTYFGAYGPKIMAQLPYCAEALSRDKFTRQAVLNIWREDPPETKDYPCTINMVFYYDRGRLSSTVNMRSSDAWLGIPYDVFNFSMVLLYLCGQTGMEPGVVTLNMVNSHIYDHHFEVADKAAGWYWDLGYDIDLLHGPHSKVAEKVWSNPTYLLSALKEMRDTKNKAEALQYWMTVVCPGENPKKEDRIPF